LLGKLKVRGRKLGISEQRKETGVFIRMEEKARAA